MKGTAIKKTPTVRWFLWEDNPEELGAWADSFGDDPLEHFDVEGSMLQIKSPKVSYNVPLGNYIVQVDFGHYISILPEIFRKEYLYKTID